MDFGCFLMAMNILGMGLERRLLKVVSNKGGLASHKRLKDVITRLRRHSNSVGHSIARRLNV